MPKRLAPFLLAAAAIAAAGIAAAPAIDTDASAPANQQANRLFVRFERIGYTGAIYLNADTSYVIVQTAPDGTTTAHRGTWSRQGENGFCIHPDQPQSAGKCVPRVPTRLGRFEHVTSSLGEDYRLALEKRR